MARVLTGLRNLFPTFFGRGEEPEPEREPISPRRERRSTGIPGCDCPICQPRPEPEYARGGYVQPRLGELGRLPTPFVPNDSVYTYNPPRYEVRRPIHISTYYDYQRGLNYLTYEDGRGEAVRVVVNDLSQRELREITRMLTQAGATAQEAARAFESLSLAAGNFRFSPSYARPEQAVDYKAIEAKARDLLALVLSEEELAEYDKYDSVRIRGNLGTLYEVTTIWVGMLYVIDPDAKLATRKLCAGASSEYPKDDRVATLVLALRNDEQAVLDKAIEHAFALNPDYDEPMRVGRRGAK